MSSSPTWVGAGDVLIEQPGSPQTEFAATWVRTRSYKGLYSVCLTAAPFRGTVGSGEDAGWVVSRSLVGKDRGNVGSLIITYEVGGSSSGAELPAWEFSLGPHRLTRALKYHPKYEPLTANNSKYLEMVDAAVEGAVLERSQARLAIEAISNATLKDLALNLFNKRRRGQDTYYLNGLEYSYTQASWTAPSTTLGGFVETPGGPLDGELPTASWLRLADELSYNGVYYSVKRTWIAVPTGQWDSDLYTA